VNDSLKKAAILPFQLIESLGIPCGYERSFKLQKNQILANRYLLGIETRHVKAPQWQPIFQRLNMPENFIADFKAGLADANTVLLGFEAQANDSAVFKLYLEYWDQLQARQQKTPDNDTPHQLHLGFKWQYDAPHHQQITHYHCLPGLSTDDMKNKISDQYSNLAQAASLNSSLSILNMAIERQPQANYLYIKVSEEGNKRQSFDLNLYPAGLSISDIIPAITQAATGLNADPIQFERLIAAVRDKDFGHISAGTGRNGQEYFTVYYEN